MILDVQNTLMSITISNDRLPSLCIIEFPFLTIHSTEYTAELTTHNPFTPTVWVRLIQNNTCFHPYSMAWVTPKQCIEEFILVAQCWMGWLWKFISSIRSSVPSVIHPSFWEGLEPWKAHATFSWDHPEM